MRNILIFKKSFLDVSSGDYTLDLKAYNYISVLTDGAFNPDNNGLIVPNTNNVNPSNCYLLFDNGDKLLLNGEVKNYPIRKFTEAKLFNEVPPQLSVGSSLQSGYGNMYFLLSLSPIDYSLTKSPPGGYVEQASINPRSSVSYWLGKWSPTAYNLLVGYIPPEYDLLEIGLQCDPDISTTLQGYAEVSTSYVEFNVAGSTSTFIMNRFATGGLTRFLLSFTNEDYDFEENVEFFWRFHKVYAT